MSCNYKKDYCKDWKSIVAQRKIEANDCCELCYAANHQPHWLTGSKVILTMHHIDCDKMNNTRQNLILLCQRCHLRLDLAHHMKKRKGAIQERLKI